MRPEPAPTLFAEEPAARPWTDELHGIGDDRRAREEAALAATSAWWRAEAEAALERLAASGQPFDAERLRAEVGDAPGPSQNAFGAIFAAASRAGLIRCIGTRTASRGPAAGRSLRVWIGGGL